MHTSPMAGSTILVSMENTRCYPHVFDRLLMPRLRSTPHSILLLGPRQVGKSTLLGLMKPDLVLNLADPGVHRRYVAHPELLLEILAAAPDSTRIIFIDVRVRSGPRHGCFTTAPSTEPRWTS